MITGCDLQRPTSSSMEEVAALRSSEAGGGARANGYEEASGGSLAPSAGLTSSVSRFATDSSSIEEERALNSINRSYDL
jgi:hypothetical protein